MNEQHRLHRRTLRQHRFLLLTSDHNLPVSEGTSRSRGQHSPPTRNTEVEAIEIERVTRASFRMREGGAYLFEEAAGLITTDTPCMAATWDSLIVSACAVEGTRAEYKELCILYRGSTREHILRNIETLVCLRA